MGKATGLGFAEIVARLRRAGCVFAEDEARLLLAGGAESSAVAALVDRRAAGEPLEHLLGWVEFCGLRLAVAAGVFVPRQRSAFLVREAAALISPGAIVVDLCCGAGAVGAALAAVVAGLELYAVDIDPVAVRCARLNLPEASVYVGDLYEPLPATLRGRVDVLAVNAPYVPTDEIAMMPSEARLHEPRVALDGGIDGLDVARRVVEAAPRWLAPGGSLLIETSERQGSRLAVAFARAGLNPRVASSAELYATVVVGSRAR